MGLRRIARIAAALGAVGLLALALRGPVASLEEPLVQLWRVIDSIPQQWLWGVLALLGFVLAFSLGRGPRQDRSEPIRLRPSSQTQHERLSELIELADTSPWARDVVGRRLSETASILRALIEGIHRDEALKEIRAGRWPTTLSAAMVFQRQPENTESLSKDYADELASALDALECYAKGGNLERD